MSTDYSVTAYRRRAGGWDKGWDSTEPKVPPLRFTAEDQLGAARMMAFAMGEKVQANKPVSRPHGELGMFFRTPKSVLHVIELPSADPRPFV